jgi:hypothetical protein
MAAYRSHSVTTYASRTNTTVTAPSGIADGDVLLLYLFIYYGTGSAPSVTLPTGFAALTSYPATLTVGSENARVYLASKDASGESGNYTITHPTHSTQALIVAVSGGASGAPTSSTNTGTGTTATATGVTTAAANAFVGYFAANWDGFGAAGAPAGTTPTFAERVDSTAIYLATGTWASSGATGNKTQSVSTGNAWHAGLAAVEAAGGGGATPKNVFGKVFSGPFGGAI